MLNHTHFVVEAHVFVICFHRQHACGSSWLGIFSVCCLFVFFQAPFQAPPRPPFQAGRADEDLQRSTVLGGAQTRLAPRLLAPNSSIDGG